MTSRNKRIIITLVSCAICLLPLAAGLILYNRLPEQLPVHYSIEGEADAFAVKIVAISLLPGICVLLAILSATGMSFVKDMKILTFAAVLSIGPLLSCSLQAMMYLEAFGYPVQEMTITMILIGILFFILGSTVPSVGPNSLFGARFPWIMDDEEAWYKTQRFTGILMVLLGIVYIIDAFANLGGTNGAVAMILGGTILLLIASGLYSLIVANA